MHMHKNKKKKKPILGFIVFLFVSFFITACDSREVKKIKDLDYTICDESRLPKELVSIIHEKKQTPFKLTYATKEYLFIVVGYGEQNRTNLNVIMENLFLTEKAIHVETNLVSGEESEIRNNMMSYPYIAIKCELHDQPVIFE